MLSIFIGVVAVCLVLILFSRPRSRAGLAPEGGSRLKNAIALLLAKAGPKNLEDWRTLKNCDVRVPVPDGVEEENYNDSWVFQGSDADGNIFLTRLGFRNGGRDVEVWFWGVDKGERYANDVRHISRESDPDPLKITAGGVAYEKLDEGSWRIRYDGTLNGMPAKGELTWKADAAMYFSPEHMDTRSTARAMAEMPWSREYFESLRSENAVRIERGGPLTGAIEFGGKTVNLDMKGVRDHSWGKRDWNFITRYIWTIIALDEPTDVCGVKAKYLAISPVDYGDNFKRMSTGWIAGDDEVKPIAYITDMARVGDNGEIPGKFSLMFRSPDARPVSVDIERRQPEMPWLVFNDMFEVNEAWCGLEVNGTKAHGIAEFGYSFGLGYARPLEAEDGD